MLGPLTKATLIQKFWSDTVTFLSILLVSWLIFMISKCASCQNNVLQNTSIRIKSFNIFWSHCDQNKPTNSFRMAGELLGFLGCKLSPFYLPCSVLLVPNGRKGIHSGPWWLIATWTGHTLELTCFLWLCLSEERLPKKDAASWGPHCGAFPSDPSLKASAAAEEIRHSRRLSSGSITTGGAQIWYRPELGSR